MLYCQLYFSVFLSNVEVLRHVIWLKLLLIYLNYLNFLNGVLIGGGTPHIKTVSQYSLGGTPHKKHKLRGGDTTHTF